MHETLRTRPLGSHVAWRIFAKVAAATSLGGRYHDENNLADRLMRLTPFARGTGAPDERLIAGWDAAVCALPDRPICHYALAAVLRRSGNLERAAEVIDAGIARFPNDLGTIVEAARVAGRRGDDAAAYDLWARTLAHASPRPLWLGAAAHALVVLGRYDEAERLLEKARRAHPRHRGLMAVECMLASAREDWPRAIALWSDFYRRYPNYPGAWDLLGRAIDSGRMSEIDKPGRPATKAAARAEVGLVEDEAVRDLLLGFESLGSDCEFGLVQRRHGAEPFGLFRWNIVWVEDLIAALQQGLAGIGEHEHTEIVVLSNREFFVQDVRWYLGRHTFKFEGQTTHAELYPKMCERIGRLRRELLDTLAAGKRIFVYCSDGLTSDEFETLHRALETFGPNRLLAVQPAEPAADLPFRGRPGDVLRAGPGRYVGFLPHRGVGSAGTWNIAFDDWIAICRKVAAL